MNYKFVMMGGFILSLFLLKWLNLLHFCLFSMGYLFLLLPILLFSPFIFGIISGFFFIADILHYDILLYKFTGVLGEMIALYNQKTYYVISILLIILCIFKIYQYRKYNHLLDIIQISNETAKSSNLIDKIKILFKKYNLKIQITNSKIGPFVTRYFLTVNENININRISSLSIDLSEEIGEKIRIFNILTESYIEVPNYKSIDCQFSHLINGFQANYFGFLTADGNKFFVNMYNNFLFHMQQEVFHGLLLQILNNQMDFEINMIGEFNHSFVLYNSLLKIHYTNNITDIISDMEHRYFLITKQANDIFTYNQKHTKLPFILNIIYYQTPLKDLDYLISYGPKVGIFNYVIVDNFIHTADFKQLIFNIISGPLIDKQQSIELFGISSAEYLLNSYDCIIKYHEIIDRVCVPKTNINEISAIIKYLKGQNENHEL